MPEFQFLTTLTVNAPSEAAAQTQADHAIEDADQYLSDDYRLESAQYRGAKTSSVLFDEEPDEPRYTVELTTEGWQIRDNKTGTIGAEVLVSRWTAEQIASAQNRKGTE